MSENVNLFVDQGATFNLEIELNSDDITFSSYTPHASFAKHYTSNTKTAFTASFANNVLTLRLTANSTANLEPGKYVYDVLLVGSNSAIRLMEGVLFLKPMVTTV